MILSYFTVISLGAGAALAAMVVAAMAVELLATIRASDLFFISSYMSLAFF